MPPTCAPMNARTTCALAGSTGTSPAASPGATTSGARLASSWSVPIGAPASFAVAGGALGLVSSPEHARKPPHKTALGRRRRLVMFRGFRRLVMGPSQPRGVVVVRVGAPTTRSWEGYERDALSIAS